MDDTTLVTSLLAAVPLQYHEMGLPDTLPEHLPKCGEISAMIASKGDILLFKSKKKGETAEVFNQFARGLAILSAIPGGVPLFGYHWTHGKARKL